MASRFVTRSVGRAATRVPGLRRIPVVTLISMAEVGMMARDHLMRLTPQERRRLRELTLATRGRRRNLAPTERDELAELVAKLDPRLLAGEAAKRLSPIPLPGRLVRGRRRRAA
jgi:hypothetical protein